MSHRSSHRLPRALPAALAGLALVGSLAACSSSPATSSAGATTPAGSGSASTTATAATSTTSSAPAAAEAPSAKDLLAKAKAATAAARSGHARGQATDKGDTYVIDSASTTDGKEATGTFTVKNKAATFSYVVTAGNAYITGNEGFWKESGASADRAAALGKDGKYVKIPADKATQIIDSASFASLLKSLFAETGGANSLTQKVESATVAGQLCWVLSDRFDGSNAKFAISQQTSLPVEISSTESGALEKLDFDQWNAVPAPKAPAASQILG